MVRTANDPRNEYFSVSKFWRTRRQYVTAHAAKHGAIALSLYGWEVQAAYPTTSHFVVAYKRI